MGKNEEAKKGTDQLAQEQDFTHSSLGCMSWTGAYGSLL